MFFDLHRGWSVRTAGDTSAVPDALAEPLSAGVPAAVPGCVHTDLLAAGLIPDPYLDRNEAELEWIGLTDWCYETEFDRPDAEGDRIDLVFDGLDTVATVELNGRRIGETRNMHRGYRFALDTDALRPSGNRLAVTFASAVRYARARRDALGDQPSGGNDEPAHFIRKMACNFGWDWGPKLVTAGIWKRCGLEVRTGTRLAGVVPRVTVEDGVGRVRVRAALDRAEDGGPLHLTARVAGVEKRIAIAPDATAAELELAVDSPELWWPHSLGGQPLHPLAVTLEGPAGELGAWERSIGFRTVALDTSEDERGSRFTLSVNGVPIFARGANWIPDDCFPTRIGAERYRARVAQAVDANIDLLRVWGGGLYESDDFYAACDAAGVLVWQDFLFACSTYPEDEETRTEVEAEARENTARLAPHPSLALWCGNNENYMGHQLWGWTEGLDGRPWGEGYYLDLLPRVLAETDPTRPYVPSSPWSNSPDRSVLDDRHGSMHIWDVWNQVDYTVYRDYIPRFASEFGWQAPPTWATLTRAVHDDPLAPDSPGVLAHQKADDGNGKLARGLAHHFDAPADTADWHFLTQVNQVRAIRTGVEHLRSHRPDCMGSIIWQINDCWPVTSWAMVDGDGRPKPLHHAVREAYADRLLTIQPRDGGLAAIAVNETSEEWSGALTVRRIGFDGSVRAETQIPFTAGPRSAATAALPKEAAAPDDATAELLAVEAEGAARALWFFAEDKELAYPAAEHTASAETAPGGYRVTVTARTLLRDLGLFADRGHPDAAARTGLTTLLPGETAVFDIDGPAGLDPEAFAAEPVLRTVNAAVLRSR